MIVFGRTASEMGVPAGHGFTAPMRIGEWVVWPDRNELSRDGEVRRLEPMTMLLLCLLAERQGQTVARAAIVERLWGGRVVTDDALHRQIAKLRTALNDDPRSPRYIETVTKAGVRLKPPVEPAAAPAKPGVRPRLGLALAAGGAAAIVAITVALAMGMGWGRSPASPTSDRPLTSSTGNERMPAISPNGHSLAYTATPGWPVPARLYVRPIEEDQPRPISPAGAAALWPAWSPDGSRIAYGRFVGSGAGARCTIEIVDLVNAATRSVAACSDTLSGIAWSGDQQLVVAQGEDGSPLYLISIDARTGARRRLTRPAPGTLGDTRPVAAPGGRVYFKHAVSLSDDLQQIWSLDPRTGRSRQVTRSAQFIGGLAAARDDVLFAATSRNGQPLLLKIDGRTGREMALQGADKVWEIAASADGRTLVYERNELQVALWTVPLTGGEPKRLTDTSLADWRPTACRDGRIAFLSSRTGWTQVWITGPGARPARQITRLAQSYPTELAWTPDCRRLIASVVKEGQYELLEVDLVRGVLRPLTRTRTDERSPSVSPDGARLFFARRGGPSGWRLISRELRTGKERILGDGLISAAEDALTGRIIASDVGTNLWALDPSSDARTLLLQGRLSENRQWVLREGVLWLISDDRLKKLDLRTGEVSSATLLPDVATLSGIEVVEDRAIYPRVERSNFDLRLRRVPAA